MRLRSVTGLRDRSKAWLWLRQRHLIRIRHIMEHLQYGLETLRGTGTVSPARL